jgi:hypothetical protein
MTAEKLANGSADKIPLSGFRSSPLAGIGNTGETPMILWALWRQADPGISLDTPETNVK